MGLLSTSHHHHHRTERVKETVEVHEHRAPTDESIKMLNEMQEKVLDNIVARVEIPGNLLKGKFFLVNEQIRDGHLLIVKFSINGYEHKASKFLSRKDYNSDLSKEIHFWGHDKRFSIVKDFVVQQVALVVAQALVEDCFNEVENFIKDSR